jgi:sulfur relay (sulfurtransferase) DsrC/TusE family protein
MATWKSFRVSDIISEIESEKFVLPVIQRRLVWEEEKMEALFDTLLKGDSFGGVMVIEEDKESKPLFNFRPFTKDGSVIQSRQVNELTQVQNFVIDGQQRLQSFYIGLKGSINGKVLYFDLYSDYNSEFEFKFENDISKLPKQSKDNMDREIPVHNWYPVSGLYKKLKDTNDEDQIALEIIKFQKIDLELQKIHITKNVKAFYKNILTSEVIGISKVTLNKSLDETNNRQRIVELFRRLNDGGTKLSPFDLVASILKGFAWEMEVFLEDTLKNYIEIGLSQDNLIKLLFLFQDNHKKEMASIDGSDANFAIENRERIKATLEGLKNFLIESKLYNYYKDGNRSFIPLFFIAYHLYHKQITNEEIKNFFVNHDAGNTEFPRMKKWIYHSLINGVFRSKGAGWIPYKTGIRKLLEKIQLHKNSDFPIDVIFEVYDNHPITFTTHYDLANLDTLDYAFIFYLIYDRSQTIRIQDIDHIIPKSILEQKGIENTKINSIKNYQLLDYNTNRGAKNANPFREWINDSVADKQAFIVRHLIPINEDIWDEDNFEAFIEQRGNLILNKIATFTN